MERRRAERRRVPSGEPVVYIRLRTGAQLLVLDLSSGGCLTETTERLLPGRDLDAHLLRGDARARVRARVVRAHVCAVGCDRIRYRVAFAFDEDV
jgi:hypothetical protein